ncbi:MAG TPA: succinate dehydrogenase cytochrome b subunit [Bryobacteraceae bacterium]|jgi:succinate dehydrogenase / fumarate reductase cytochrome b subunit|nr:succinate dehydrogenase cytochrome b subunit [Bryobacteraceae bacterium]
MSAIAVGMRENRAARFWDSTNGKKVVMAVTGAIMFLFIIGHLVGNLQVFEGPDKFNAYGRFLRVEPLVLWAVRLTLIAALTLHIVASVQLALRNARARPAGYAKKQSIGSSYASRTMYWSGPIILAFLIYHLLHLTFGAIQPESFHEGDVYGNLVAGFQVPYISAWYIFSLILLGFHLRHGVWSMFQSVGFNHPRHTPVLKGAASIFAWVITLGFISIPVAVLAGWIK